MKICNKCQAENQDDVLYCAACGEVLPEEAESAAPAPKNGKKKVGLILALLAALAVIAVGVVMIINNKGAETPVTEVPGEVTEAPEEGEEAPAPEIELAVAHHVNAHGMQSYSIHYAKVENQDLVYNYMNEAAELVSLAREEVDALMATEVAACADYTMTNLDLNYYYLQQYGQFAQAYGMYMAFLMDPALGLDEQQGMDGVNTWQHGFVQAGADMFHRFAAVAAKAEEIGLDLSSVESEQETAWKQLEETAAQVGFEDAEKFLSESLFPGATKESYMAYLELQTIFNLYVEKLRNELEITDKEIESYYAENEQTLTESYGVNRVDKNVVNVRHILIKPESTTAEDGTTSISEEAWAAAEKKAQDIYDQWLAGEKTEDSFSKLATELTEDPGSQQTGGLYEEVYPGQMVPEFDAWCFEDGRKVGDHGVVKTDYGYHIMFFSGEGDYIYWMQTVESVMSQEQITAQMVAIEEEYPMTVDLTKAVILDATAPTDPAVIEAEKAADEDPHTAFETPEEELTDE